MIKASTRILDAVDLETFILCKSEEEGKALARRLLGEMGFLDGDIVFFQKRGIGARVRLRASFYRPGDDYPWLEEKDEN